MALRYLNSKSSKEVSGVLIFHAFRTTKEAKKESVEEETKKWEMIREKENWEDYVVYSPHFHFVGYVGWMEPPLQEEDFVYKMITDKNGKVRIMNGKRKDVFHIVSYLLSHTVDKRKENYYHSYTWVGNLADREGKSVEEERLVKERERLKKSKARCKACGKGALWYAKENMNSWLKVWCHILRPEQYAIKRLIELVERNDEIEERMKMNVIEGLELIGGKDPPPNYADYLVDF